MRAAAGCCKTGCLGGGRGFASTGGCLGCKRAAAEGSSDFCCCKIAAVERLGGPASTHCTTSISAIFRKSLEVYSQEVQALENI